MDLKEILDIIRNKILMITIITVIVSIIGGCITFFVLSPVYETNATVLVNKDKTNNENNITGDDLTVNQKLALTYGEIIKSRKVLSKVIRELDLDITVKELSEKISVSTINETEIINITVEDTSKSQVYKIANKIVEIFTQDVEQIVSGVKFELIDKPIEPQDPVRPNKIINIAMSVIIGLMTGILITFLLEYLDDNIKSESDIEKILELPVIGVIPDEKQDNIKNTIISKSIANKLINWKCGKER